MKQIITVTLLILSQIGFSQTIFGKWKTIDDETGKEKGIVEIFEKSGKVYGKIIEIFEKEHKHQRCEKCEGEDKNKHILGLLVIKGLIRNGDYYDGGKVLDPKNGKKYHCKITLDGKEKLIVRGYIGIPLFGRSQTWIRL